MAFVKVQSTTAVTNNGGASLVVTFPSTATVGNLLTVRWVTDGTPGTVPSGYTATATAAAFCDAVIYYKLNAAGTETSVTVAMSPASGGVAIFEEWSGVDTSAIDTSNTAAPATANPVVGAAVTTTNANDLILGLLGEDSAQAASFTAMGGGFTQDNSVQSTGTGTLVTAVGGHDIVSATGTYTPTYTNGNVPANTAAVTIAFKAATATTGTPSPAVLATAFQPRPQGPAFWPTLAYEYGATGPTVNNSALAGALSFTGAITKQTSRGPAGVLSFTGARTAQTARAIAAVLSFTGAFTKQTRRPLAGVLSFTGAQGRQIARALAASLGFTGAISRQVSRAVSGTLSFTGAITKQTGRGVSGVLSSAGSLISGHSFTRALTGALSFTGSLSSVKAFTRALSGVLSFTGAHAKQPGKSLSGVLSFSGAISRQTAKAQAAVLSSAGATANQTRRAMAGAVSSAGQILSGHSTAKALTAALSFTGNVVRQRAVTLAAASLGFAGSVTKQTRRPLAAAASFAGTASRQTRRAVAAALGFVGTLVRQGAGSFTVGSLTARDSGTAAIPTTTTSTATAQTTANDQRTGGPQ